MKTNRLILYALCMILCTACASDEKKEEEIKEAWAACNSITGSPSGGNVSGMVYEIDSINSGQPDLLRINDNSEGAYYHGYKYVDDPYDNFTMDLSKASSVLCIELKTTHLEACFYPSKQDVQFTILYYHTEANLALLAWPSKELLAQDTLTGEPFEHTVMGDVDIGIRCPSGVMYKSGERTRDLYEPMDLDGWLEKHVTIVE